jgi:hypothetical protein
MQAIAHSPEFAKKAGVSQSVGKDFTAADKGRKFEKGGDMATKKLPPFMGKESKAEESKEKKLSKSVYRRGEMAEGEKMPKFAKGGGVESKGKTKGKMIAMARGGKC